MRISDWSSDVCSSDLLLIETASKHVQLVPAVDLGSVTLSRSVERAIGWRARRFMPFVILLLYAAGIGLAWQYRALLAHPFDSSFATLLSIKIILAISVGSGEPSLGKEGCSKLR